MLSMECENSSLSTLGMRPAQQSWTSSGVPFVCSWQGQRGWAWLCAHTSQLGVTLGLHKGQGSAHPNTTWQQNNKHEVVSAGIFQLKEGKERAEHWLVVSTCHDSSVCPGQSPAGDKQLPCKTPAGNLVHNTGLAFFTSILLWQFKPSGFCCSFFSSGWSNQIKHM